MIQLKLCTFVAIGATSPYWLWQIWAFILPGLHPRERKWSWLFIAVAGPLFLAGMALGFYIMPKGLAVLIGFTQTDVQNLVDVGRLIGFMTRMLLVFGLAFEIPLFVVMLNLVGVLPGGCSPATARGSCSARSCSPRWRPRPPTRSRCCFLAFPMLVLFGISEVIARGPSTAPGRAALRRRAYPWTRHRRCDRRPSRRSTRSTCPTGWEPPR